MRFGAHISIAQGYEAFFTYAEEVGCECAQIFAKSPRQWAGPAIAPEAAYVFRSQRERRGFGPVFTHTAYLINLATPDENLRARSIEALADELVRGGQLGVDGVVTHVGAASDEDYALAAVRVGSAVAHAFEIAGADPQITDVPRLLLENTAGAGTTFGGSFEQLASAVDVSGLSSGELGVCFDTCHAFAFGMPLEDPLGWNEVVRAIESTVGLDRLTLIHANDCMFERGSKRDRHAWIGDGHIGETGFMAMVCTPELANLSVVTEMPGERPVKDVENIARLKRLREACSGAVPGL